MAKTSGSTRTSRWAKPIVGNNEGEIADLYFRDGRRVEYDALTTQGKKAVKEEKKRLVKEMYKKLQDVSTPQMIDENTPIEIHYTSKGLDHFCNDALLTLSGKYFSEQSMMRVNEIIENATYIPTPHGLTHSRSDDRELWFSYKDADGRGIYFKVSWQEGVRKYTLYSVVDKI